MPDEITAEYSLAELNQPVALEYRLAATVACKTDLGRVRDNNEDKFEYYVPEDEQTLARRGHIYLVCDGMGGHNAGQIASELTSKTFIDSYLNHPAADITEAIQSAIQSTNRFVHNCGVAIPTRRGMGTTFSGLIFNQNKAYVAQIGDSRVYRLRGGSLAQLSPEHTWIAEVVAAGMLSHEEAAVHQMRHVITRAVGTEPEVTADIIIEPIETGDLFLLCSDGLTNHVSDTKIFDVLSTMAPSAACWEMVAAALIDGGSDNCTAMVVRVDELVPL